MWLPKWSTGKKNKWISTKWDATCLLCPTGLYIVHPYTICTPLFTIPDTKLFLYLKRNTAGTNYSELASHACATEDLALLWFTQITHRNRISSGLTKPFSNPSPFAHVICFLLGHELSLSHADQLSLQILSVLQKGCRFVLHHSQSSLADSLFGRNVITVSRTITFTQS